MTIEKITIDFNDYLLKKLKNKEYAETYLKISLEEFQKDGDLEILLICLNDVVRAQVGFTKLAQDTHLNRQNLYKQLSEHGNPSFATVLNILNALGFRLTVTLKKPKVSRPRKKR